MSRRSALCSWGRMLLPLPGAEVAISVMQNGADRAVVCVRSASLAGGELASAVWNGG